MSRLPYVVLRCPTKGPWIGLPDKNTGHPVKFQINNKCVLNIAWASIFLLAKSGNSSMEGTVEGRFLLNFKKYPRLALSENRMAVRGSGPHLLR